MFDIFRKRLKNPDSPYFLMVQNLIRNVSFESLITFGMNLGYNSWTYGVRRLREASEEEAELSWIGLFDFSSDNSWNIENILALIEEKKKRGIYTYAFLPYYNQDFPMPDLIKELSAKQPDRPVDSLYSFLYM